MVCEVCGGVGEVMLDRKGRMVRRIVDAMTLVPCPECGGCGRSHCCEGERPGNVADPPRHPCATG